MLRPTLHSACPHSRATQLMAVGGNGRARAFFKQHGWDELGADKIEQKYTSRAAQLYKSMIAKEAAKLTASAAMAVASGCVHVPMPRSADQNMCSEHPQRYQHSGQPITRKHMYALIRAGPVSRQQRCLPPCPSCMCRAALTRHTHAHRQSRYAAAVSHAIRHTTNRSVTQRACL